MAFPFIAAAMLGGSLIGAGASIYNSNKQINAQQTLNSDNQALQRELTQRREQHEQNLQQLNHAFQSTFSKEMHMLQKQHDLEIQQLNFEFQDRLLDRQEIFTEKMQQLQRKHETAMAMLRAAFDNQMQQNNAFTQEHMAFVAAWYRFLDKIGTPPFPQGQFIQRIAPLNTEKPFIIFDTKVYQEDNHPGKKILPFNPMQLLYSSFSQINNEYENYANVLDIPIGFGSRVSAQYFCESEFYDKPVIIVYSTFSGTRLDIKALCNGIFSQQLYTNAEGKTNVNPSKFEEVLLCSYALVDELIQQPLAIEAIYNCIVSSYLQMLLDNHRTYFRYNENVIPIAEKVFQSKLAELKQYFEGNEEFEKIDNQLKLHVESVNAQINIMQNNSRLAMQMRHPSRSTLLEKQDDSNLEVYQVGLKSVFSDNLNKLFKYDIDENNPLKVQKHKIIMLLGATGSGKTTLINGMINYIFGVEFNDNIRYKLIVEQAANQAKSITKNITAYTLHNTEGTPLNYKITIIDTPGFGDTEGLERDGRIVEQIREFFSNQGGISHLDAVGFVAQSSLARLTQSQRYIFDSILSLFGKDIVNNIFMMLTFADGQKPPALAAIDEHKVPYNQFFKFNNSALLADNNSANEDDNFDAMFWKMGQKSFEKFFKHLESTESVSLSLTKDVLRERKQLEATILGLRPLIDNGLSKMSTLKDLESIISRHETEIEQNKKFKYTIKRDKFRKVPTPNGLCVTTCLKCHKPPCHKPCHLAPTGDKRMCAVMTNEHCTVCGCHWSQHANTPYIYESYTEVEEQTSQDLFEKYNIAVGAKNKTTKLRDGVKKEFIQIADDVLLMTEQVRVSLSRLDQIALKPNPLTSEEYLELLIQDEKNTKRNNWQQRVTYYEEAKKQAQFLVEIAKNTDGNIAAIRSKKENYLDNLSKKAIDNLSNFGQVLFDRFSSWLTKE